MAHSYPIGLVVTDCMGQLLYIDYVNTRCSFNVSVFVFSCFKVICVQIINNIIKKTAN